LVAKRCIKIPRLTWYQLVAEVRRRGKRRRESGAFLLGGANDSDERVQAFVCYDDLDPDALSGGAVAFHAKGYCALWSLCSKSGMKVLADVHTHPTADVRQSSIDRDHPMLPVAGHVALILPRYGHTSKWSLEAVGVHVFQGQGQWTSFAHRHPDAPIRLCMW
jgi:proteasome lid subunit RPN8/RPN11